MKKITTLLAISFAVATMTIALAQKKGQPAAQKNEIRLPMKAENWISKSNNAKFAEHNGIIAAELPGDRITAKDLNFGNGTIEFDLEFVKGFVGIYFRQQGEAESEFFYLRDVEVPTTSIDAIQYAPIIKTVNMWDMYYDYQSGADFRKGEWTHIKLVISGAQMLVYVNDKSKPALVIPKLEGNTKSGTIAFEGICFVANVVIKPDETEGLSATEGFDPTYNDIRYIRKWQVSEPQMLPPGQELNNGAMPDALMKWTPITAERLGLINLTRIHGVSESRRYVWLRTKILSKTAKKVKMDLGFSDEVWVFINDRTTFVDKNLYGQNMRKKPDGRISIDNSGFELQLVEGENDLVIGVSNNFYGWGIMARLESLDGLTLSTDYKPEVVNKEFEQYFGLYASKDVPVKFKVSQKNGKLSILPTAESPILFDPAGKDKFTLEQYGITIEFKPAEGKLIFTQGKTVLEFIRE